MVNEYDMSAVEEVKNRMIPDEYIQELSAFFKVFGEENRYRLNYIANISLTSIISLVALQSRYSQEDHEKDQSTDG